MKTICYLATAVVLVASAAGCTRVEDKDAIEGREITITASFADNQTKTTLLGSGKEVYWEAGDEINLFYDGTGSCFVSQCTEPSRTSKFLGSLNVMFGFDEDFSDSTPLLGLYPYRSDATADNSSVTTILPSEQTGKAGSFAKGMNLSLAKSTSLAMGFYNVCGGVRFSVTRADVKEVVFEALGGESIAGKVKLGFSDGVPAVNEVIEGEDTITLTAPGGGVFETGKWYYIVALPGTLSGGFKMTFNTDAKYAVLKSTDSRTISRSKFGSLADADKDLVYKDKGTPEDDNIVFEDANFKAYCVKNFDTDKDGEISYSEAAVVKEILCYFYKISSLVGIEYFTALTELNCGHNQLTSLDVSKNTALTYLFCDSNQLASLDVSNNTALTCLFCDSNQLTTMDLSNNTALNYLDCCSNQLTSLDVSKNTALTKLDCRYNQLTSLAVSNNTALIELNCDSNQLASLDVSKSTSLTELSCGHNQLTSLDVSKNTALTELSCGLNQLTSLDVSKNTALTYLYCSNNQLTSLDVSNNTALTYLFCASNQLASLDVSNNTALTKLWCYSNKLTSLDVSKNTALTELDCSPMSSLSTLYVASGQEIEGVTKNRNNDRVPDVTEILIMGVDVVDLGLSVKWASRNIGASKPEEYGKYFAWGDVVGQTRNGSSWSGDVFSTYPDYELDSNSNLKPGYDAAHVNLGGSWRMPTKAECDELINNCTATWTTDYNGTGVAGRIFTSKKEGYTDKSIFLPAAGSGYKGFLNSAGFYGCYWSSTFSRGNYAWYLVFSSVNVGTGYNYRSYGQSVRPVSE